MTDAKENDAIQVEGRQIFSDNDLENVIGGVMREIVLNEDVDIRVEGYKYWFRAKALMAKFIVLSNYLQA